MAPNKRNLLLLLLFPLSFLLNYLYGLYPEAWERFYSMSFNKWFISSLSRFFGLFSFSVFELLIYVFIIGSLLYSFRYFYRSFKDRQSFFKTVWSYLLQLGALFSVLFFVYTTFWGLNYKRPLFAETYNIKEKKDYTPEELSELYAYLLSEASIIRQQLPEDENGLMVPYGDHNDIFERAQLGFDRAGKGFASLLGNYGEAKPIVSSEVLNYTGVTGIYSPFTGEPNINIAVPAVTLPSTTCHEMAHQRGYGFENECNFIAYITCLSHPDLDFQYSGLIMAISYTSNALATADYDLLIEANQAMDPKVLNDLKSINAFWSQYEGKVQEVAEEVNNSYLQANGVDSGTASYGEMVNLLLALYDTFN